MTEACSFWIYFCGGHKRRRQRRRLNWHDINICCLGLHGFGLTLKGSAAMLGANRMSALAAQLQTELHGSRVQVEQAARKLEDELAAFRAAATERLLAAGGSLDD